MNCTGSIAMPTSERMRKLREKTLMSARYRAMWQEEACMLGGGRTKEEIYRELAKDVFKVNCINKFNH